MEVSNRSEREIFLDLNPGHLVPVRCTACAKPIARYYHPYRDALRKGADPEMIMNQMGLEHCCRRMLVAESPDVTHLRDPCPTFEFLKLLNNVFTYGQPRDVVQLSTPSSTTSLQPQ